MADRKRATLDEVMGGADHHHSFEKADQKEEVIAKAQEEQPKKAGRPMEGKSKATNKVTIYLNDEDYQKLLDKMNYQEGINSPSKVVKKLLKAVID